MTTKPVTPAEVAGEIFEALGKRDLGAALALVAGDCADDFVAIGEFRGRAAIGRFFEESASATCGAAPIVLSASTTRP